MHPSAGKIIALIQSAEAPRGYGTLYANKDKGLKKPITSMTVDEVLAAQPRWSKNYGSSAAGGLQIIRSTLAGLKTELGLKGTELFDVDLQNRMGEALLKRRGLNEFLAGHKSIEAFALGLAQEWASFPVLVRTQGAHRVVNRGESYYAGDAVNHALITPEKVEQTLRDVLFLEHQPVPKAAEVPAIPFGGEQKMNSLPTVQDWFLNFITSKINWAAAALVAALTTWVSTHYGFDVPKNVQDAVTIILTFAGGGIIMFLRTFMNSPKVSANQPKVVLK